MKPPVNPYIPHRVKFETFFRFTFQITSYTFLIADPTVLPEESVLLLSHH